VREAVGGAGALVDDPPGVGRGGRGVELAVPVEQRDQGNGDAVEGVG
jgi:hypothetical protein